MGDHDTQYTVKGRRRTHPKVAPPVGTRFLIKKPSAGIFWCRSNKIAERDPCGCYNYYDPEDGMMVFVEEEGKLYVYGAEADEWTEFASARPPKQEADMANLSHSSNYAGDYAGDFYNVLSGTYHQQTGMDNVVQPNIVNPFDNKFTFTHGNGSCGALNINATEQFTSDITIGSGPEGAIRFRGPVELTGENMSASAKEEIRKVLEGMLNDEGYKSILDKLKAQRAAEEAVEELKKSPAAIIPSCWTAAEEVSVGGTTLTVTITEEGDSEDGDDDDEPDVEIGDLVYHKLTGEGPFVVVQWQELLCGVHVPTGETASMRVTEVLIEDAVIVQDHSGRLRVFPEVALSLDRPRRDKRKVRGVAVRALGHVWRAIKFPFAVVTNLVTVGRWRRKTRSKKTNRA